jgi:uncharacterized membrane protein
MLFFLKLYLATVPVFFLIDMIWLGFVARDFYREQLGALLSPKVNWTAAILFYLLFIAGILIFAVLPALEKGSWSKAAVMGALFGLFTYATYDLTNLATLNKWPLTVVVVDIVWGMVLCASVASVSYLLAQWLQ